MTRHLIWIEEEEVEELAAICELGTLLADRFQTAGITQHEAQAAVGWPTMGTRAADDFEAASRFKDKLEVAFPTPEDSNA